MKNAVIWLGGTALLAAIAIDVMAFIGRQIGLPLNGSIEFIQPAVLVAGAVALLVASMAGAHARVHLLVDRLRPPVRNGVLRATIFVTALFFLFVLAGSVWLAADMWNAHEIGEITGVPWRWMRLFANICFAAIIVILVIKSLRRRQG